MRTPQQGFTLIELMIGMAIFGLLTLLALPMYGDFLANTQVRTAAESVLTGVRLAQTEAVRRSVPVRFELVGNSGWQVVFHTDEPRKQACVESATCTPDTHIQADHCDVDSECVIKSFDFAAGAAKAYLKPPVGGSVVTFSSLGVAMAANNDATQPMQRVDATTDAISLPRTLRVVIGGLSTSKGGTTLCDPNLATTEPFGCPAP